MNNTKAMDACSTGYSVGRSIAFSLVHWLRFERAEKKEKSSTFGMHSFD